MQATLTHAHASNAISAQTLADVDKQTIALSKRVTDHIAQDITIKDKIDELHLEVAKHNYNGNKQLAVATIKANYKLVKKNIDHKAIFSFLNILLNHNDKQTADELFQFILDDGDKSLISNVSYIFSRYYLLRNDWNKIIELLKGTFSELPDNEANYAYLIYGTALQHLKKHREAVKHYEKIGKESDYYAFGQLNIALAYIRQGWWTDAHLVIKSVLNNKNVNKSDELINRLYLVLGYSLLQKDYYRDSRNAFRKIEQTSQYANRALLGISLTAANQNDFFGSLNLLTKLKDKKSLDLSVDESYLLVPYVYSNLKQYLTASASYNEALTYYKKRIDDINKLIESEDKYSLRYMTDIDGVFIVQNNILDITERYPVSFVNNIKKIDSWIGLIRDEDISDDILALYQESQIVINKMIRESLTTRKEHLNSYLNQSRYGLARMYDTNQTSEK